MKTSEFDYSLPPELIAQTPIEPRDHSRFMVLCRHDNSIEHHRFFEIAEYLRCGDILVLNNSQVIPARLKGHRESGGKVELLLLRRREGGIWETLARPARRVRIGDKIEITHGEGQELAENSTWGEVLDEGEAGLRVIQFADEAKLERLGEIPLPPYIHVPLADPERYQTVYAKAKGSVAAPTAGLHFTPQLLDRLREKGVELAFVTLHVGLDSFRPIRTDDPQEHKMHREYGELDEQAAAKLSTAKAEGRRIICGGTTTVRVLEQAAIMEGEDLKPFKGWVNLFILPGHRFRMVDGLITNFHLPRSTLLMLVCAFASKELINRAYQEATKVGYRFYSYGDAMLIL